MNKYCLTTAAAIATQNANKLITTTVAGIFAAALAMPAVAGEGNGAPNGKHYNLNLIGMQKQKPADMNAALDEAVQGHNGHVIFVGLGNHDRVHTKIWLTEGEFKVLDANGTDGEATFRLPANDCEAPTDAPEGSDCTNETDYSVWVRALGKPGGTANITTCRTDTTEVYGDSVDDYCSTDVLTVTSETGHGKKQFENVTKELTTICADYWDADAGELGQDGICDTREQLFAFEEQYWWDYDNYGLRLAQLRFYERP